MTDRAGTVEGVRRANLARILQLAHLERALSRSRLTALTGLNRSTVADLVAELTSRGLTIERAPDPSHKVGRPSPVVAPDPSVVAIAANPEVDALTMAAIGLDGTLHARRRIDVDHLMPPEEAAGLIAEVTDQWRTSVLAESRIVAAGVAVPGLVRALDGLVRVAPHLEWTDAPIRTLVESATGLPTAVGNDASLGALAEHLFGAGQGIDDLVYLNGGASGIGGGLIVHGIPVGGMSGYAGEFGQNRPGILSPDDRRAAAGVLEDEVSRARLLSAVGLGAADEPTLAAAIAMSDSPTVALELARQRRILSTALANVVNVLNPAVVVLGGFLATIADSDPDALDASVRVQCMPAAAEDLEIRTAVLAEDRLLVGAAEAAFAGLLRDPLGSLGTDATTEATTA
ncbi:ROK family protein [Microbacterium sp. BWT-B31]|uniref:ROK family protein n=1 Tax=Microbacterium sp. BWT-B31 TaxID=3232072 RepID=UPI003527459C